MTAIAVVIIMSIFITSVVVVVVTAIAIEMSIIIATTTVRRKHWFHTCANYSHIIWRFNRSGEDDPSLTKECKTKLP